MMLVSIKASGPDIERSTWLFRAKMDQRCVDRLVAKQALDQSLIAYVTLHKAI
jgi:hypothetical protein